MSRREFDQAILDGEKYLIVDNLVLDVKEFIRAHPGGKFVIGRCIGLDISKYFFGGYEMESGTVHSHSYYAK
jgi:cytochrome b involved in lipid metabolism